MGTSRGGISRARSRELSPPAMRCRRKFLRFFPGGFQDATYIDWERGYKATANEQWTKMLARAEYRSLLRAADFAEIAARAVRIESRTNLLFSFEKMALRDAIKSPAGARLFATSLFEFLHGSGAVERKFERIFFSNQTLPGSPRANTASTFSTSRGHRGKPTPACSLSVNKCAATNAICVRET